MLFDLDWLRARSVETEAGCWQWTRGTNRKGYAVARLATFPGDTLVNRIILHWREGVIPLGHEASHLCDNTGCVNPDHLIMETGAENQARRRGKNLGTHCRAGLHELAGDNIYRDPDGDRNCKACKAAGYRRRSGRTDRRITCKRGHLWAEHAIWEGTQRRCGICRGNNKGVARTKVTSL